MNSNENPKEKRVKYRIGILAVIAAFIMLVTFCAYMINTSLEDTIRRQRGSEPVTHDYTFEDSSYQADESAEY